MRMLNFEFRLLLNPMKSFVLLFVVSSALLAQAPPAGSPISTVPPETVVAEIDGVKLTAGEMQTFLSTLPQQSQQNLARDPEGFLKQMALVRKLAAMGEANKLYEESPYKEQLQQNRMMILSQAQLTHVFHQVPVSVDDQKKFYEQHKDRYLTAKVKAIYIAFSNVQLKPAAGEKPPMSEEEARAKAEKLVAELKGGADFADLVKKHSDDQASKANGGDYGNIQQSDQISPEIKAAVFALKAGEVSAPVRSPNGFYIFKLVESGQVPFDTVRDAIYMEIKQTAQREFLDNARKGLTVKIDNPEFFQSGGAPANPLATPGAK